MDKVLYISAFDTEEGKQSQGDPGSTPTGSNTEETVPLKSSALQLIDRPYILTNMVFKTKV